MSKMNPNEKKENASKNENVNNEEATNLQEEQSNAADETAGSDNVSGEVEALQKKYSELNDSLLCIILLHQNIVFQCTYRLQRYHFCGNIYVEKSQK